MIKAIVNHTLFPFAAVGIFLIEMVSVLCWHLAKILKLKLLQDIHNYTHQLVLKLERKVISAVLSRDYFEDMCRRLLH